MSTFKEIVQLLSKESSKDALRNILVIIIPTVISYYIFNTNIAISIAVGILLSCLTDLPGNKQDKLRTAKWCIPIFFVTSLSTAYVSHYESWLIIPLLLLFGFTYTFITLLGFRISVVGNLGLIVASFTIGLKPTEPLVFSVALTIGAIIFFSISTIQVLLHPYRSLKYAIDEGIENMSSLLALKVECYDENSSLTNTYKSLSMIQIKVTDQLENVRSLILREKNLLSSEDKSTKLWLSKLYQLVDLYELLTGIDTDYENVRRLLTPTNTLPLIRIALSILANETRQLSSIQKSLPSKKLDELNAIIAQLDLASEKESENTSTLIASISTHLKQITQILIDIKSDVVIMNDSWIESQKHLDFAPTASNLQVFKSNFNFSSPIFSYAIRMAALLTLGGIIGFFLPEYRYASWILLTIILVARPTYVNTQKRNYQRIVGSIAGLAISFLTIIIIKDHLALLIIATICLYLFLLFNKPNYLVCVIFITITIVIFQKIYEGNTLDILSSRFAFTLLGAGFAILGCIVIPINHFRTIQNASQTLVHNFKAYFDKIQENIQTSQINFYDLRLLRKFTQTSLANCYDTLEQFSKEPIQGKNHKDDIHHFQSLAYRINALLVGLSVSITKNKTDNHKNLSARIDDIKKLIEESEYLSERLKTLKTAKRNFSIK